MTTRTLSTDLEMALPAKGGQCALRRQHRRDACATDFSYGLRPTDKT
jgi:hypothetical protein